MSSRARDFNKGGFTDSSFIDQEDADPRVGLVNLADVMLVFACGLMVALVVNWNIKLPQFNEVEDTQDMSELDQSQIDDMAEQMINGSGTGYTQKGVVYEDPTTKKLYMLESTEDGSDSSDSSSSSDASSSNSASK